MTNLKKSISMIALSFGAFALLALPATGMTKKGDKDLCIFGPQFCVDL